MVIVKYSRLAKVPIMKQFYTLVFIFMNSALWAQVGIGTNTPDATLDVNGTVRITSMPLVTVDEEHGIGGLSTANKLNKTELGLNIFLSEIDGLITAPVASAIGYRVIVPEDYSAGRRIDNMDIYLGPDEVNERATFIIVSGYTSTTKLGGISGGYHGRWIKLYFSANVTVFNILEDNINSDPQNRFYTLNPAQLAINGNGLIEMVYDENGGPDGLGRWIIIKFRE